MSQSGRDMKLFWTCFISLVATSFGFIVRADLMDTWAEQFKLSETQKGEIFGVGLWPFAISIVLFSLIVDRIGYRVAMIFAFICHALYMVVVIAAPTLAADPNNPGQFDPKTGYWVLYLGSFIGALGNGTVEAVINPVVATMFNKDKTKWLNILHAGWPGGLVLGGVLALALPALGLKDWRFSVGLVGIPVVTYGILLFTSKFPVNERVSAGVSFRDMLKEVGFFGALLVSMLIVFELGNVVEKLAATFVGGDEAFKGTKEVWDAAVMNFTLPVIGEVSISNRMTVQLVIVAVISGAFGLYTMSAGRFLFVFLMCIMMPLAITELGTDSWITDLVKPEMAALGLKGPYLLIYTSFIMMVLRFFAGPIVHKLSPLGLLATSAAIAAVGLFSLSLSVGLVILAAATLYGFGKTFFWPTMLGVVAERFPKGGALTLNAISGLGMMAVGILGNPLLGNVQDKEVDKALAANHSELHAKVAGNPKTSLFGEYRPLDDDKVKKLTEEEKTTITDTKGVAKKNALKTVALFPVGMFVAYCLLLLYFRMKGGYKAVSLGEEKATAEAPAGTHG
jgi:MFS family permease